MKGLVSPPVCNTLVPEWTGLPGTTNLLLAVGGRVPARSRAGSGYKSSLGLSVWKPWGADPRTAGLWARGCLACQSSVQAVLWRMSVLSSPSARRLPSLPEFRASGSLAGDGAFLRSCEEGYLAFRSSVQAVLWRATVLSSVAGPGAPRGVVAAVAAVAGCPSGCPLATECCVCACLIKLAQSGSTQRVAQTKTPSKAL